MLSVVTADEIRSKVPMAMRSKRYAKPSSRSRAVSSRHRVLVCERKTKPYELPTVVAERS